MSTYAQYQFDVNGYEDVLISVDGTERRAAASLGFLRSKSTILKDYILSIQSILARLSQFETLNDSLLSKRTTGGKILVFISGDKGLVGDYYYKVFSFGLEKRHEYSKILCIGEKSKQYLEESHVGFDYLAPGIQISEYEDQILTITKQLKEQYFQSNTAQIDILAAKPHTLTTQIPYIVQLLPLSLADEEQPNLSGQQLGFPVFESKQKDIIAQLTSRLFHAKLVHLFFETTTAEFSARTVAMEQAKDKTHELLRKLRREYYKSRTFLVTQKQQESFMVHKLT